MGDDLKRWRKKAKASEFRANLKQRIVSHLGGRCSICGYQECMAALHVHHLDELSKRFNISDRMTSWSRVESELGKCVLLCANHHAEVHAGMHPTYVTLDTLAGHGEFPIDWDE